VSVFAIERCAVNLRNCLFRLMMISYRFLRAFAFNSPTSCLKFFLKLPTEVRTILAPQTIFDHISIVAPLEASENVWENAHTTGKMIRT